MAFDAFSKFMIQVQHKIYYVVLSLARFNLYANSYGYLAGPKPKHDNFWKLELAGVAWYWMYFGGMLWAQRSWQMRLGFLLVSHIAASPVHVQVGFLASSSGMIAEDSDCSVSFRLLHR
jgi:delta8-fatty-acid desaturase